MIETISPIRGPFKDPKELLDSLWQGPLRVERLSAIEQRLRQDPSILAQIEASHIARMLELLPLLAFDDWVPSDQFAEDFFAGKMKYDHEGYLLGGPPDARLSQEDPYEGSELELSEKAKEEGRILDKELDEFIIRSHVERAILEHFRRTQPAGTVSEKLLAETKFWPLLEELESLNLVYGSNNPVTEAMDFLSVFLSPTPACPRNARDKLKQVFRYILDHCDSENLTEIVGIARCAVDDSPDTSILTLLRERFRPILSSIATPEQDNDKDVLYRLLESISRLDQHTLYLCLATLPGFFARVAERDFARLVFDEPEQESTRLKVESNDIATEALVYEMIVKLAEHRALGATVAPAPYANAVREMKRAGIGRTAA